MLHARHVIRAACLASAACAAVTAAPPAIAAQGETGAAYDLPAQPLGETLRAIARVSGRDILFEPANVEGRRAPALKGQLTAQQALALALAGSGLAAEERAGAFLVRPVERAAAEPAGESPTAAITVTGTRIRGGDSPSPVTLTTRRQLEEAGVTDLAGFTRLLPQNYTGGVNPGIAGGGQQNGQNNINNSAALNLRGLGPDATLTLINGHRVAYDALSQGVDIAAIPLAAVERIEIIPDGASALYGSDAVGGVANIILRRDFSGLETTARIGASTEGGNFQQQYSAVTGGRWRSGGFMVAGDLSSATPIYADQRYYTHVLDPSLTLTLRNRQASAVFAGHQILLPGVELELDATVTDRRSMKQSPFQPNRDVTANGLITRPSLLSWAVTPTLRIALPAGWEARLSATRATSRTAIDSRRYLSGAVTPTDIHYNNSTTAGEVGVEGPLFRAPGGEARLALGGGFREIALTGSLVQMVSPSPVVLRKFSDSRSILFGYGELSLPLIAPDLNLPFAHRLSLSGALRYERYRRLDAVATPKLGFVYEPVAGITLRGSWGRSFKAPTLDQVNQVTQGVLAPAAIFQPQPTPPLPASATVLLLGGGNPALRAERASTWSGTLELRPRFMSGFTLQTTFYRVDYRDRIASPITGTLSALANPLYKDLIVFNPTAAQLATVLASLPQGLSNQTGKPYDPAAVAAIVDTSLRNTARVRAQGIDVAADYRLDLGGGERLLLTAAASYLESNRQLAANQPVFEQAGTIFNPPHWHGRAGATWQSRTASVSGFVNYLGGVQDNRYADGRGPGPFVTVDLSAVFRAAATHGLLHGAEVRFTVVNLLNKEPETIRNADPSSPSYDSTNYTPVGRFVSVSLRKTW